MSSGRNPEWPVGSIAIIEVQADGEQGFEHCSWRPSGALWTRDWQIRPLGQAWLDLVHRDWKTDATLKTDSTGAAEVRGFFGDYEIKVNADGKNKVVRAKLSGNGTIVDVVID